MTDCTWRPTSASVGVIGAGYVGATTAAALASLGHSVHVVDSDTDKARQLGAGVVDLSEPGLGDLVRAGLRGGRLSFSADYREVAEAEIVFVCVPTPMSPDGSADLGPFDSAVHELSTFLTRGSVVVIKSTVPVGTGTTTAHSLLHRGLFVVNNPEFLREGHTVEDFLRPDRIVLGGDDRSALGRVSQLYRDMDAPVVCTSHNSAELAKYASNSFLALKLSFVDELAALADKVGADIRDVTSVLALDPRIGESYLKPGPGWGGSCLPKDTRALTSLADAAGSPMRTIRAAIDANEVHIDHIAGLVMDAVVKAHGEFSDGTQIAVLGLTFKAGTGDLRRSPALDVVASLRQHGAHVRAHDPAISAVPTSAADRTILRDLEVVSAVPDLFTADTAAVVVLTEWPEYRQLDWKYLARRTPRLIVVDTRSVVDDEAIARSGLHFIGNGHCGPRTLRDCHVLD